MAKLQKSLSNTTHVRILQIIGQSKVPVSSRGVEKELMVINSNTSNSDAYRIVKELAALKIINRRELFVWEDLDANMNDGEYKRKLVKRLNHFCSLKLKVAEKINGVIEYGKEEYTVTNNRLIEFRKAPADDEPNVETFSIFQTEQKVGIMIYLNTNDENRHQKPSLSIFKYYNNGILKIQRQIELIAKKDIRTGKNTIYIDNYKGNVQAVRFLKISYKNQELAKAVQKGKKIVPNHRIVDDKGYDYVFIEDFTDADEEFRKKFNEMEGNPRNYRYSLNIRGLLLYLLGVNDINIKTNKKHTDTRKISRVLENLSENCKNDFPFLLYYKDFQRVLGKPFMIHLFKDISVELQNQLDTSSIPFLTYWVTFRYISILNKHLSRLVDNMFLPFVKSEMNRDNLLKFKHYKAYILEFLKEYQEKQLESTNYMIKMTHEYPFG